MFVCVRARGFDSVVEHETTANPGSDSKGRSWNPDPLPFCKALTLDSIPGMLQSIIDCVPFRPPPSSLDCAPLPRTDWQVL